MLPLLAASATNGLIEHNGQISPSGLINLLRHIGCISHIDLIGLSGINSIVGHIGLVEFGLNGLIGLIGLIKLFKLNGFVGAQLIVVTSNTKIQFTQ